MTFTCLESKHYHWKGGNAVSTMDRKEFLSLLGISSAAFVLSQCLSGCQPMGNVPTAPSRVDFTLDLTNSAYSALNTNAGYLYKDGIIVARTVSATYIAVSQYCTHAGGTVIYDSRNNDIYCPVHGSIFSNTGSVIQGPAGSPLVKYNTSLSGTSLRVYS
jgi:cytochrome b6-f complex iron-sulfur subunit